MLLQNLLYGFVSEFYYCTGIIADYNSYIVGIAAF